jgi:pimeloyl-ACP methyl ester carboxylesterase
VARPAGLSHLTRLEFLTAPTDHGQGVHALARSPAARKLFSWTALSIGGALAALSGCTWISYLGTDPTGSEFGRTYYVGGAGPFGHVGTIDVPNGLRQAGYRGSVEVFAWQSVVGGTLRDQIDRSRNEEQARRLARRIQAYLRRYPGRPVNLIALSAGTGIVTWALENLPDRVHVNTVVFLASSLSRNYDLTRALRHVDNKLYCFYSADDPILRYAVPIAGSVDRERFSPEVAGLLGFVLPPNASEETARLYDTRVQNMPYRRHYARYGYRGRHTDTTSVEFIQYVVAPLLTRQQTDTAITTQPHNELYRRSGPGEPATRHH